MIANPTKVADYHNHPADHMTLKVDDVLQQMKTRCRNELTLVPAIYEEQLVKLRHTEWSSISPSVLSLELKTNVHKVLST
jgi:hypothetical protein